MARRSRMSSRSRGKRRNGGNGFKITALVALPVAALGAGGFALSHYTNIEQPNGYCYERPHQHKAAVLIDSSFMTLSSPTQRRDYLNSALLAYDNAPANAQISVISTASNTRGSVLSMSSTFTMCKPAETPWEQEAIGAPDKPAPYLHLRSENARREYVEAVETILADAANQTYSAKDSPILEQIKAVSRFDGFQGSNRSLTILTDGVENSQIARFCVVRGDMPPFKIFKTQARYESVRPKPFTGVDVTINLVEYGLFPQPNFEHCTTAEIQKWWPDYFKHNGAASVETNLLRHWAGE